MMDKLPGGKAIGEMQAPLQWIFSHTARFAGAVRITMQDGEGVVLVQKGVPLAAQFKHPLKSLNGPSALKYFDSQPILDFGLWKYETDEMQEALDLCRQDEALLHPDREPPAADPPREHDGRSLAAGAVEHGASPGPFGAVLQQPGVTAVACFSDGLCLSSAGDLDADYTVAFAEDLLRWSLGLRSAAPACGAFVQMTLFYRGGNVIIAPYGDEYLCIFTTPEVQFGQIRRMIRELQNGV
ncbi:roadblock/LC7 domain-containing protein [Methanoculleus sp. YWC-01]|jgi:hypothetical protein|uniref:Roadblock/LC7 domain-containing protein n=1 Tax=Methanoculleus nereidis TaxID=2735141 RepID=A0ABU3Z5F4_9EURY|nr:roadblock/LC7 domain-containing protein [Methanoculleus sp. YWC-01]MCK9298747.1 roadblock/LC7 domain-containing protein [Methanoculleus sp.]MDV4344043.1 roadblock/LC7 domain-containing protein [Methanoculleus sp. YWC-01]